MNPGMVAGRGNDVHVALLRGINLRGRRLPMKDLAALFREAGCNEVRTYIQSGNVVFEARSGPSASGPGARLAGDHGSLRVRRSDRDTHGRADGESREPQSVPRGRSGLEDAARRLSTGSAKRIGRPAGPPAKSPRSPSPGSDLSGHSDRGLSLGRWPVSTPPRVPSSPTAHSPTWIPAAGAGFPFMTRRTSETRWPASSRSPSRAPRRGSGPGNGS